MIKKITTICLVYLLILLGGCSSKELNIKTAENLTVEYGEELDNDKLFNAKESDENIKVKSVDSYDKKKLGEQTLKVTFTDGKKEAEKTIIIKVEDTKKPVIELKKETIKITAGDKLTLKDNIKSVNDPIDGDLKYSDKEIKKDGFYIDKGKLNTDKDGEYTVTVKAFDKNGNTSEKTFKVVVEKKKETNKENNATASNNSNAGITNNNNTVTQQPSAPSSNGGTASAGNGSSNSDNSSNSGGGTSNVLCPGGWMPEKACNIPISEPSIGSDGIYYNTMDEADAAGMKYMESQYEYGYDVYSVDFNDRTQKYIWVSHKDLGIN